MFVQSINNDIFWKYGSCTSYFWSISMEKCVRMRGCADFHANLVNENLFKWASVFMNTTYSKGIRLANGNYRFECPFIVKYSKNILCVSFAPPCDTFTEKMITFCKYFSRFFFCMCEKKKKLMKNCEMMK